MVLAVAVVVVAGVTVFVRVVVMSLRVFMGMVGVTVMTVMTVMIAIRAAFGFKNLIHRRHNEVHRP